jgi:hypothetical protein
MVVVVEMAACDSGAVPPSDINADDGGGSEADLALEAETVASLDVLVDMAPDPWSDPNCHWDCHGGSKCEDGVVTAYANMPVPCTDWKGDCPIAYTYECKKGCRTDGVTEFLGNEDATTLCRENAPKYVGAPCAEANDCLPFLTEIVDGKVVRTYLACDAISGKCVAVDPPVVPDWLAPCGMDLSALPPDAYGYVSSPACGTGFCLVAFDDAGCVRQGCTATCENDWDCPQGAVCEGGFKEWPQATSWVVRLCKPGPHGVIGMELACPGG